MLAETDPFYKPYVTETDDDVLVEVWKSIPDWDAYQISTLGRIKSRWKCGPIAKFVDEYRLLKPILNTVGYEVISLVRPGQTKQFHMSRLVLTVFYGLDKAKPFALHNNGFSDDNRLINLRWGTSKENAADMYKHKRQYFDYGEKHVNAVLTNDKVIEIRKLYATGQYKSVDIDRMFGLFEGHTAAIINGKIWKTVQ